jgi:tRNA-specific 2-thiouridylase
MNDLLSEHFSNPRNAGELTGADGVGLAGDAGCGAVIHIFIKFDGDRLAASRFLASGSSAAIAAGSLLTEMITGSTWREAASLAATTIEAALSPGPNDISASPGGLVAIKNAASFAVEALHGALEDSIRRVAFPRAEAADENTVLVAMSGGVDSSVACLIEQSQGRNVVGVTMRLWSDPACTDESASSCCSPRAIRDARAVCHLLGLPHLTVDYKDAFVTMVVEDFVDEYRAGRTPNPCTRCNGGFRFPELAALADRLGAAAVATGHYARITTGDDKKIINRGADGAKDQSYMLWGIDPGLLHRLEFPLGDQGKRETRRQAREAGLPVYDRPESQEVCFIPDNDYRRFLRSRLKRHPGEGEIIDSGGVRLGVHTGYIDYTVGQRHGLGVSAPDPLYVLKTIPEQNRVVVGGREELAVRRFTITKVNSFVPTDDLLRANLAVQPRYNSVPVAGRVIETGTDRLRLELEEPVYGVAAGQSAVIYAGDMLMAGGVIAANV